ncbi:LPS assembly lipoprotein LptE [Syntrophorhabdus aromaticivorans]|uniref:LPS-assembly lipoprotein LptE n=1 Tax=Syntrophorhabdus aromaticivorans TaxID=328301 RepID=A0A351U566_9BACT|nr:LPS assembly lipoprotein LptE [Syntrophorhabdus aromaticivorans]NLW35188.1 hypothetical protein [Syntrophorhabdus aromaticivorans]HBA55097.1 hypothetical protein [Syntrophorhabdus aromaticivorans]
MKTVFKAKIITSSKCIGLVFLLVGTLCACGYELVREKGIFSGDIALLSVPIFKNITYEPHASLYVTNAFSRELLATGLFKMGREGTDGYLEGTIREIRTMHNTLNVKGLVIEKKLALTLDLVLFGKDGRTIKRWTMADEEAYRTDAIDSADYNKRYALQKVSARMARRFCATILVDY